MVRVAVLGAGVNGLACAVKIKEKYTHFDVVLISKDFSPDTTGDGSAGLWYPYLCGETPPNKLTKWGVETYKFMHKLWLEGGQGVSLMPTYMLYREVQTLPAWRRKVFGFHELNNKQLEHFSKLYSTQYSNGYCFTTFTHETGKLLPYLLRRFEDAGGIVRAHSVTSLMDPCLDECQVVINCTGLGSRYIVPDPKTYPIRGQVARIKASWINEIILDEHSGNYVIPNVESCVLGGTHQENDFNRNISETDADFILNGCRKMLPGILHSEIMKHWTGLRPGREEIRIEQEEVNGKLYIHNYGHGGSGVTLFWGCATEVLKILQESLPKIKTLKRKSKL